MLQIHCLGEIVVVFNMVFESHLTRACKVTICTSRSIFINRACSVVGHVLLQSITTIGRKVAVVTLLALVNFPNL